MRQDTQRLEEALRGAHAAGDTEAAQRIARQIRAERASGSATQELEARSGADAPPGFNEMLSGFERRRRNNRSSRFDAFMGGTADAFTLGSADEMAGGVAGLTARAKNAFGADLDPDEEARIVRERARENIQSGRDDHPITTLGGNIVGGVGLAAGGAGATAAKAPRLAQAVTQFARNSPRLAAGIAGGLEGAAYGVGSGEGVSDRARRGLFGGSIGALAGPALMTAGGAVQRGVRRLTGGGQRALSRRASRVAANIPDEALPADRAGSFLGERSGPEYERFLIDRAQRADPAAEVIRNAAARRRTERTGRVIAEVQRRTGSRRGVDAIADVTEAKRRAAPLFAAADRRTAPMTPELHATLRAVDGEGVSFARASRHTTQGNPLSAYLDDVSAPEGQVGVRNLRDLIADVEDAAEGAASQQRGRLWAQARQLRTHLKDTIPEFAEASQIWRGARVNEEARRSGQGIFAQGVDRAQREADLVNVVGRMDDMSAAERGQFLSGVLDAIEGRMGSTSTASGNAAARLNRVDIRNRLAIVFGEDEAESLSSALLRQSELALNDAAMIPLTGSHTALRQAGPARFDRGPISRAAGSAVSVAKNVRGSIADLAERLTQGGMSEREALDLARLLVQQGDMTGDAGIAAARTAIAPVGGSYALPTGYAAGASGGRFSQTGN